MVINLRKMRSSLIKKGFEEEQGSNHIHYVFHYMGKKTSARTMVSRGTKHKDWPPGFVPREAKKCKLSKDEFIQLVDCSLSRDDYVEILKKNGAIPTD